jgi:hypothetical protein
MATIHGQPSLSLKVLGINQGTSMNGIDIVSLQYTTRISYIPHQLPLYTLPTPQPQVYVHVTQTTLSSPLHMKLLHHSEIDYLPPTKQRNPTRHQSKPHLPRRNLHPQHPPRRIPRLSPPTLHHPTKPPPYTQRKSNRNPKPNPLAPPPPLPLPTPRSLKRIHRISPKNLNYSR